jgi:threonylcarbamoyladenosine tRNA methylthiotransferase MtaB
MSVEIHTLGCRLNLAESEELAGMLAGGANLVVVNSCAVTSQAVRQTRQTIRRARRANPCARLLVTGCAAQVERAMLAAMPEVDGLIANDVKLDPRAWNVPAAPRRSQARFTRAFVQVQNGCDHSCTFCVIPQGRGPSRSRSVGEVLAAVARHVDAGLGEVVLTGVDLTSWGADLPDAPRLGRLAAAILERFPALSRLRLSSIDGAEADPELFELIAGEPRMMPHVHLSLQSGDDMVLKRMKRRHSRADAVDICHRLRELRPDAAIGADLIAGFPTETEAMFGNTLALVGECGLTHLHVFPYSARTGTPAARMPQVPVAVRRERAARLREAGAGQMRALMDARIGGNVSVLVEKDRTGRCERYLPVAIDSDVAPGALVAARIMRREDDRLIATVAA